jgi:hypothetical protein
MQIQMWSRGGGREKGIHNYFSVGIYHGSKKYCLCYESVKQELLVFLNLCFSPEFTKGTSIFLIWSRRDWLKKYGFPGSNNYTEILRQDTPYDRYMWVWILEVWRMDCSLVSHFHGLLSQLPWILGLWTAETYIFYLSKDSGSFQHPLNLVVIYIHRSVVAILEYDNL